MYEIKICIIDSKLLIDEENFSKKLSDYLNDIGRSFNISFECSVRKDIFINSKDNFNAAFLHKTDFGGRSEEIQNQCMNTLQLYWTSTEEVEYNKTSGRYSVGALPNINGYNSYKELNWGEALEEWHNRIQNSKIEIVPEFPIDILTKPKETDYLTALVILCKGYLTAQVLRKKDLLLDIEGEIKEAIKNIGIYETIEKGLLKNLTIDIESINKESYWLEVFDNTDKWEKKLIKEWKKKLVREFEKKLIKEWEELTKSTIPNSWSRFFDYLKGTVNDFGPKDIALMYNEMYPKLKDRL